MYDVIFTLARNFAIGHISGGKITGRINNNEETIFTGKYAPPQCKQIETENIMDNQDKIKQDEERIQHDKERLIRDAERLARDEQRLEQDKHDEKKVEYVFILDDKKYETKSSSITGADVRAKLPPDKAGYAIFLESHGSDPDKQITDSESFSLEKHELCFYSVPPATFGSI